jgi:hypothetical protein
MMSFSNRLFFQDKLNRLSLLVEKKKALGESILDLTESNPTRIGLNYPDNLLAALAEESSLHYSPVPAGSLPARLAVAAYYAEKGKEVCAEDIFLAASTSEAYSWMFKLLADPGDSVLIPRPGYPLFDYLAAFESVRLDHYPLRHDAFWRLDLDALKPSIIDTTRAIIYVNPNNPTGSYMRADDWAALSGICSLHSMALIIDEVFSDYRLHQPGGPDKGTAAQAPLLQSALIQTVAGRHDCLNFILSGLSKLLCLPQMKLAWIVISGPKEERQEARSRLEFIADTYLSVNTPVQNAVARWMAFRGEIQAQVLKRVRGNLLFLEQQTKNSPCDVLDVEGGWYAVVQVPTTLTEEEWALSLLEEENVLVHPGYFFDFDREAFLIVSLLPPPEVFESGVQRIMERISRITTDS